jgi:hypothetical protein
MRTLSRLLSAGVVLVLVLVLAGCRDRKKDTAPEPQGNPLRPDPAGGAPAQGVVRRGAQRQVNTNLLENFGKYYELYRTENGRPVRTLQEFRAYLASDPNARYLVEAIDKDWIVFRLDPPPNTNQVLAYEKEEFEQFHNRLVLFGGGAVKLMTDGEFRQALMAQ